MSVPIAAVVGLCVLAAAGALPVLVLAGPRWPALALSPLAGAALSGAAATATVAFGGPFLGWFAGLAVACGAAAIVWWRVVPAPDGGRRSASRPAGLSAAGLLGALAAAGTAAWGLTALSTPSIGFDARAVWLLRAGWFTAPHHQLLFNLRAPSLVLGQTSYPPLVSSSVAVVWSVTGVHTLRLGVVVVAVLNACALWLAAMGVVELARQAARRTAQRGASAEGPSSMLAGPARRWLPLATGVLSAPLLVLVAFGTTEPFTTNGYADPLWSFAAVGAVCFGLQQAGGRRQRAVALALLVVAGMTKNEGVVVAGFLTVLVAARWTRARVASGPGAWRAPVSCGAVTLAAIAAWPALMFAIGARRLGTGGTRLGAFGHRAWATVQGFAPYLHVLWLAVPVAVVGALLLRRVREEVGMGNDGWAWAALAAALVAVGGAYLTGSVAVTGWLEVSAHRVTECGALVAWWIVAGWAVVGAAAISARAEQVAPGSEPRTEAAPRAGPLPLSRT